MIPIQTLSFILSDGRLAGCPLSHLLAMRLSTATLTNTLDLFFSTYKIRIRGMNLEHLRDAILEGRPTAPRHLSKPTLYYLSSIESIPYRGWNQQTPEADAKQPGK